MISNSNTFLCLGYICSLALCVSCYGYKPPFRGYQYNKPARLPPLQTNSSSTAAGMQSDYIEDLIEEQKQQILSNVLGGAAASASTSPEEADLSPFDSDAKAFRVNRCASCCEYHWALKRLYFGLLYSTIGYETLFTSLQPAAYQTPIALWAALRCARTSIRG